MKTKICNYCHAEKTIDEFGKNSYAKDKLRNICKECDAKYPRKRSKKIPRKERVLKIITSKKDRINNLCINYEKMQYAIDSPFEKFTINIFDRKYKRCPSCEKLKLRNEFSNSSCRYDKLCSTCKECSYIQHVEYSRINKDKYINWHANYAIANREKINSNNRVREAFRKKHDTVYKIKKLLRFRIHDSVKDKGWYTKSKITDLIGCSVELLKNHLQQTAIKNGYVDFDINNYSGREYHIDHIIPCVAFNLKCGFHQKLCFNYSNLQILTAHSNLIKYDKVIAA